MKGFTNGGNTCYFNVSLKSILIACPELKEYEYNGPCEFTEFFFRLIKAMNNPDVKYVEPRPLLELLRNRFPNFTSLREHDAQECILCIIDILEKELPYFKKKFYGIKQNEVIFPTGKNISKEEFSMHILESERRGKLLEMLKKSRRWETIEGYIDDEGNKYNLATRRSIIKQYPQIFMISFDAKTDGLEIIDEDENFELIGAVAHVGYQHSGHYVFLSKENCHWFVNDDMLTTELNSFPKIGDYYVLMYKTKIPQS
jgi:ubiquitin C-terminal hydrolase